ncbi:sigma-54 interaction domain-containing protein [Marivivens aquimaris]|uniref:sigma-54 interaction domain-containing protein n=1 Tax=Marivivens aquimaris TaxID=2774876 RepID=UPI00188261E5|nr:sigma-54 dependent transcriptional regulator [Marivivens aquimaris]
MPQIHIVDVEFTAAAQIAELLERRRIQIGKGTVQECDSEVIVVSSKVEAASGGTRGLIDAVRKVGAKTVIIVTEGATHYEEAPELGGRLVRVSIPTIDAPLLQNAALLTLGNMLGGIVGAMAAATPSTAKLIDLSRRVARSDVTVFINGPTGSGKEVLARQIHSASRRADKPFVAINCAAIPENMLEAILFGHEKGAFTGASTGNKGIIRAADGGTLLLDEVSEMPMGLQSKLLRVLQERAVTPIGSQTEVAVDIRIVATSNRNMPEEVRAGRFREDLFYRLNVFPLATQALNMRNEDVPVLAAVLTARHCPADMKLPLLTAEALCALQAHHWPGNVRELENVIQRALVLCENDRITPDDLVIDAGETLSLPDMAEAI